MSKFTPYSIIRGTLLSLVWLALIAIVVVMSPVLAITGLVMLVVTVCASENWTECKERLDDFFGGLWCGFRNWLRDFPKTFTEVC